MSDESQALLRKTPLHAVHVELGAKMVPFAGYEMPVQYPTGIIKEHLHTRAAAGLFDVSHMGQTFLRADRIPNNNVGDALERLVPSDLRLLSRGAVRYSLLLNDHGGIVDDLTVTRPLDDEWQDHLYMVVNAARKEDDYAYIADRLGGLAELRRADNRALLALQGPKAAAVLVRFVPEVRRMTFMTSIPTTIFGIDALISRSGYTGEDGFELSVPDDCAEQVWRRLMREPEVAPVGLGARDSLRLEAGLCLYGHDIDETTTPVEAGLTWVIGKRRREEGGFPGFGVIKRHLEDGAPRRRVGLRPESRSVAREGTDITDPEGRVIGRVTSGGYGPTVGAPVAMGYVETAFARPDTQVALMIRGQQVPARVTKLPFVQPGYHRG